MGTDDDAEYFRLYTSFSPLEEQGVNITHELEQATTQANIPLKGARVLDLGCGPGHVVAALRQRGCEAFGIELSDWALSHPMAEAAPYLSKQDATDLRPFPDHSFDLLIANLTPHIAPERMVDFLRGCARVAKSGTLVRYITPAWLDQLVKDLEEKGPEARRLYAPWARDHTWWREIFAQANLRELSRVTEATWDTWVLLASN